MLQKSAKKLFSAASTAKPFSAAKPISSLEKTQKVCLFETRPILLSLPLVSIEKLLHSRNLPKFRLMQILHGIYQAKSTSFEQISTLPKDLRQWLDQNFAISGKVDIVEQVVSIDGTTKMLIEFSGKDRVECVYIPNSDSTATLCVSSQVGCSLKCTFCRTGTQRLKRNLEAWEMTAQVILALRKNSDSFKKQISNIVLMGQGEPLLNYRNLKPFVKTLTGVLGFHPSKITLSTSGVAPLIGSISSDLGCSLAISLHAPNDGLRSKIMPINNQYPLNVLMKSVEEYILNHSKLTNIGKRHGRVTFEYVMLQNVNDNISLADELVHLIKRFGNKAHVNLIRFHTWEGSGYSCSSESQIKAFQARVKSGGVECTVRISRGEEVAAACGQLKSE